MLFLSGQRVKERGGRKGEKTIREGEADTLVVAKINPLQVAQAGPFRSQPAAMTEAMSQLGVGQGNITTRGGAWRMPRRAGPARWRP